jgi:Tol biopolymer transport system component
MSIVKYRVLAAVTFLSIPLLLTAQKPPKPPKPGGTPPNPAIAYEARTSSGYHDLMVMDADGRNQTRLLRGGDNMTPSWSPDGEWIAFARTYVTNPGIYMIRRNGTGLCKVVSTQSPSFLFHSPTWSPRPASHGHYKIVYVDRAAGMVQRDLFAVDAICDAEDPPQRLTDTAAVDELWPAWSQGDVLAASVALPGAEETDVYLFDVVHDDEGGISLATGTNLTPFGSLADFGIGGASWTQDGTELVVTASLASLGDLWLISATSPGITTRLTSTSDLSEGHVTWSPDYTYLAFDVNQQAIYRATVEVSQGVWSLSGLTVLARPAKGYTHVARPSWRPVP